MKKRYLAAGAGLGAVGGAIAWKFLTRPAAVVWQDVERDVIHSEHSHFADVDGLRVHYQEFGDPSNPTMILLHGYTASVYVWKTVAPRFAALGFHVVAMDLIGFGFSQKPAWFDYKIVSQARVTARFMNRIGVGRAIIVGSSYGGAVASTLALDYAERVEKLVLVDAVCNDDALAHPLLKLANVPVVGEVVSAFIVGAKPFIRRRLQNTIAPANHGLITDDRIAAISRPLAAADAHHSVLQTARSWDACRIERDAQFINQPTLIVWGEDDKVINIRSGERLHDQILNSRFVVFKNCGHIPQEEKSDDFINVVTEFAKDRKGRIAEVN